MATQSIYEKFHSQLERYVARRVRSPHQTQDVLQEIYLRVHQQLPGLRDQDRVAAWLFRIARNVIVDTYRGSNKTPYALDAVVCDSEESRPVSLNEQLAQCIRPMVLSLPESYREAVWLSEIEGYSQKEVARRLNLSYTATKSRVQRGRAKLREQLNACCEIQADAYGNILEITPRSGSCASSG